MPSTFLKITGFVLLLLCWGCEEPVELEHSEKERLVVACHFSAGEPFKVYVSKTNDPLSSQAPTYLNNASVSIHREEGGTCHLPYTQDFTYPSDFYTDENCVAEAEVYTLHVKAESFEEVWAMDSLPPPVDILSSGISDLEILAQSDTVADFRFRLNVDIPSPATTHAAYYLLYLQYERLPYQVQGEDTIAQHTGEFEALHLETIAGNAYLIPHYDENLMAILIRCPEGEELLSLEFLVSTPRPILLSKDLFQEVYLQLRSISEAYYRYHLQLTRQQVQTDTFFIHPVVQANNIVNGYGVFAAFRQKTDTLPIDYE